MQFIVYIFVLYYLILTMYIFSIYTVIQTARFAYTFHHKRIIIIVAPHCIRKIFVIINAVTNIGTFYMKLISDFINIFHNRLT